MLEDNGAGGTDDNAGGDDINDQNDPASGAGGGDKKVAYPTYKKTVDEVKRLKAELRVREEKLTLAEQEKLSAEGKKDELIAKLRGDNEKLSKGQKDMLKSVIASRLDDQLQAEAARLGCVDLEAVSKLVDLSDVEVDEKTFRADKAKLTEVLEDLKKSKPYLFNKVGPKINGKLPSGKVIEGEKGKKLSDLSKDELWQKLRELK